MVKQVSRVFKRKETYPTASATGRVDSEPLKT